MQNWCYNELIVDGDWNLIAKFREKAQAGNRLLSLWSFVPAPDGLLIGGTDNRMKFWAMEHWGTASDVHKVKLDCRDGGTLCYSFYTARKSPLAWLKQVCSDYPSLDFVLRFNEPHGGAPGVAVGTFGKFELSGIATD